MTLAEYTEAMARVDNLPPGQRHREWRRLKSERQRTINAERRRADPDWWASMLALVANYRRERAANDADYRALRNAQAK